MYVDYQGHFKLITCIIKLVSLKGSGFIFEILSRALQTDKMQHKTSQNLKGPKMIFCEKKSIVQGHTGSFGASVQYKRLSIHFLSSIS